MPGLDEDEFKRQVKAAIKEWLDDQFMAFGKWSFMGLAALGLGALLYFILVTKGWKAP